MTVRLSMSSLTGTARTLVAVGTSREASMFCAVRAGAPRSVVTVGSLLTSGLSARSGSFGVGPSSALSAFAAGFLSSAFGSDFSAAFVAGFLPACASAFGSALPSFFFAAFFAGFCSVFVLPEGPFAEPLEEAAPAAPAVPSWASKNSHQALSTLFGSFLYCSYISSTSHSLAPNSDTLSDVDSATGCFASSDARSKDVLRPG